MKAVVPVLAACTLCGCAMVRPSQVAVLNRELSRFYDSPTPPENALLIHDTKYRGFVLLNPPASNRAEVVLQLYPARDRPGVAFTKTDISPPSGWKVGEFVPRKRVVLYWKQRPQAEALAAFVHSYFARFVKCGRRWRPAFPLTPEQAEELASHWQQLWATAEQCLLNGCEHIGWKCRFKELEPAEFTDLTLEVEAEAERSSQYLPVRLVVTLRNETKRPVAASFAGLWYVPLLDIFMTGPNGTEEKLPRDRDRRWAMIDRPKHRWGCPESGFVDSIRIMVDQKHVTSPGRYRFRAEFHDRHGKNAMTVRSKPAKLKVVELSGRDRKALRFIEGTGLMPYITGTKWPDDELDTIQIFLQSGFDDTVFAPYAKMTCAQILMRRARGGPEDRLRAIRCFEEAGSTPGFADAPHVWLTLALMSSHSTREEKGKLLKIVERWPDSWAARRAAIRIAEIDRDMARRIEMFMVEE